jgi:acetylornithine deacetylase
MKKPALQEMLTSLIATPSVSCTSADLDMSNRGVIDLLAEWLEDVGFSVEILSVPEHPGKFNLIGTLGKGTGGLILSGHTDTVPFDDNRWTHDPFRMTENNSRFYGLGSADMKSFLALAVEAAAQFDAEQFQHPLIILATADEETAMSGARALCAANLEHGRYAVIGEPTGLRPIRQHKGVMMEAIILQGQSGHSSNPELGNNALEGMQAVMVELLSFRKELQQRHHDPAFAIPVPTMNFGHIHGGDNPNRICGECELHLDLRPLPGMQIDTLRRELHQRVESIAKPLGLGCEFKPLFAGIDAMQTIATSPIVTAAESLTGFTSDAVAFGTEGPYLNKLGIETVILGPGSIDQAHQPDEFLALDQIKPTIEVLRQLIDKFCIGSSPT